MLGAYASSGGGEPDDGVDGDGELGSGGEFIVTVKVCKQREDEELMQPHDQP